jgi:hypothetical protein
MVTAPGLPPLAMDVGAAAIGHVPHMIRVPHPRGPSRITRPLDYHAPAGHERSHRIGRYRERRAHGGAHDFNRPSRKCSNSPVCQAQSFPPQHIISIAVETQRAPTLKAGDAVLKVS